MNLFAVDHDPVKAAECLPSKLIVKMPLETCQMLAVNLGPLYLNWGHIRRKDGQPYGHKGFRNHPSTIWGRMTHENMAWMITHGLALCGEYSRRYGKVHASTIGLLDAKKLFEANTGLPLSVWRKVTGFARAMPEKLKNDSAIDDVTAYRLYVNGYKAYAEWKRRPEAKPSWWNESLFNECLSRNSGNPTK
jgi:hypothetical protein